MAVEDRPILQPGASTSSVDLEDEDDDFETVDPSDSMISASQTASSALQDEAHQQPKRKGGRKPIYSTSEERKQRNRQAQAAFRTRRSDYIKNLEQLIKEHERELTELKENYRTAADKCTMLGYKNALLERILVDKGIDVQAELDFQSTSFPRPELNYTPRSGISSLPNRQPLLKPKQKYTGLTPRLEAGTKSSPRRYDHTVGASPMRDSTTTQWQHSYQQSPNASQRESFATNPAMQPQQQQQFNPQMHQGHGYGHGVQQRPSMHTTNAPQSNFPHNSFESITSDMSVGMSPPGPNTMQAPVGGASEHSAQQGYGMKNQFGASGKLTPSLSLFSSLWNYVRPRLIPLVQAGAEPIPPQSDDQAHPSMQSQTSPSPHPHQQQMSAQDPSVQYHQHGQDSEDASAMGLAHQFSPFITFEGQVIDGNFGLTDDASGIGHTMHFPTQYDRECDRM